MVATQTTATQLTETRPLFFKLRGLSPLLMNSPESMLLEAIGQKKVGVKKIPTPQVEAAASRYLLPDGNFYVPAVAVRATILGASAGLRAGKSNLRPILAAALILTDPYFPLVDENGNPIPGDRYEIDIRRVVIQRKAIPRARAKIELPWFVNCVFDYNPMLLPDAQVIIDVANRAGQICGLLDYRPNRGGWFGRYEVASWSA